MSSMSQSKGVQAWFRWGCMLVNLCQELVALRLLECQMLLTRQHICGFSPVYWSSIRLDWVDRIHLLLCAEDSLDEVLQRSRIVILIARGVMSIVCLFRSTHWLVLADLDEFDLGQALPWSLLWVLIVEELDELLLLVSIQVLLEVWVELESLEAGLRCCDWWVVLLRVICKVLVLASPRVACWPWSFCHRLAELVPEYRMTIQFLRRVARRSCNIGRSFLDELHMCGTRTRISVDIDDDVQLLSEAVLILLLWVAWCFELLSRVLRFATVCIVLGLEETVWFLILNQFFGWIRL